MHSGRGGKSGNGGQVRGGLSQEGQGVNVKAMREQMLAIARALETQAELLRDLTKQLLQLYHVIMSGEPLVLLESAPTPKPANPRNDYGARDAVLAEARQESNLRGDCLYLEENGRKKTLRLSSRKAFLFELLLEMPAGADGLPTWLPIDTVVKRFAYRFQRPYSRNTLWNLVRNTRRFLKREDYSGSVLECDTARGLRLRLRRPANRDAA